MSHLFAACCVKRRRKILIIFLGIASLRGPCGAPSFWSSALALLVYVPSKRRSRSSSSIRLSEIKGVFYDLSACTRLFGTFGARGMMGCSKRERGILVKFGPLLDFMSFLVTISKNFCNYSIDSILLRWLGGLVFLYVLVFFHFYLSESCLIISRKKKKNCS